MNWDKFSYVMEQYAIKTDVIASEDDYFMATHMPFSNLEVIIGGKENGRTQILSEEKVYQDLVCNPDDIHRMIIVRGNNGTGKSHLIRWLRARYKNDSSRYNPEKEKIVFLRRLNNTIRGAISQILDEKIITDADMVSKLQRFVKSADSQDPDTFKTTIYHAFVSLVANDKSEKVYKTFVCKGIQDFLYDPRVRTHLLREDGAIGRCYRAITSPSDSIFGGEAIFNTDDFTFSRAQMRELTKNGSEESQDFAQQIYDNTEEIEKLVKYLNQFTPKVIQSCAEISSESTKEVFKQLRKSLKSQGKGLTIFIEDFTAFTGIDAELITVLSAEHGGENSDLCRVTAVIGITDAYYGQFKDNFTDRVQYQINVTENAYGTKAFIEEMTARYLNAIYCDPKVIRDWSKAGADINKLPVSKVRPEYPWDEVVINNTVLSLYPFTKQSLSLLYNNLKFKTPRQFLIQVIRAQLKEFFDGMQYGVWKFPTREFIADAADASVQMKDVQASQVDRQDNISDVEKARLKLLLAVWGDKTALSEKIDSEVCIGGIPQKFFAEVGLGVFEGFGKAVDSETPNTLETPTETQPVTPAPKVESQKQRQYNARKRDITAWYSGDGELAYSADYRKWILKFVRESINWQAEGIPAHIAASRFQEQSAVYIHGQSQTAQTEKAIVVLEKNIETYDLLNVFCEYDYYGGWQFDTAVYYQIKLVNWIEKNKAAFKAKVCGCKDVMAQWPVIKWCFAVEYLLSNIIGRSIDKSSVESLARTLFENYDLAVSTGRVNTKWNDVLTYIKTNSVKFNGCKTLLIETTKTYMGTISDYKATPVQFYRTLEIISAVEDLQQNGWDLSDSLPADTKASLVLSPADLLKELYPRINSIVKAEIELAKDIIEKLKVHLGGELTIDAIVDALCAVSDMYTVFNANSIPYNSTTKAKFDVAPIDRAKQVMNAYSLINEAYSVTSSIRQLELFSTNPLEVLSSLLADFSEIERIAVKEKETADNELKRITGGVDLSGVISDSIEYLGKLADKIEALEVSTNVN